MGFLGFVALLWNIRHTIKSTFLGVLVNLPPV